MSQPNIVCISVDSLRADYWSLSANGNPDTTPFLESLASDATVYQSAITPSSWTLPVHTSVFTGLYPPEHGVLTGEERLGNHPTFAELLSREGYSTNAFYYNGWFDTADIIRGFKPLEDDEVEPSSKSVKKKIADFVGRYSPTTERILETGYETQRQYRMSISSFQRQYRRWRTPEPPDDRKDTLDRRTVDDAVGYLKSVEDPFCMFVHLNDTHYKYDPPNPYHLSFTDRSVRGLAYNFAWWQDLVYGGREDRLRTTVGDVTTPEREVTTFKNLYKGGIRYCDVLIEELVNTLKRENQWDDTILVVFGDHGDGFGEDGIFGHQYSVHDSIIRVPLLIRDPTGTLEPGTVSTPVSLVDVYPTVLGLAGVSAPDTRAIDLTMETRQFAFTHYDISGHELYLNAPDHGVDQDRLPAPEQHAVWKDEGERLTWFPGEDEYDGVGDSDSELKARLKDHMDRLDPVEADDGQIGEDAAQRLKDIGYLQ